LHIITTKISEAISEEREIFGPSLCRREKPCFSTLATREAFSNKQGTAAVKARGDKST